MQKILLPFTACWTLLSTVIMTTASAQVFDGPGLQGGTDAASAIDGPIDGDPRTAVTNLLITVLNFTALAATIAIIVAGLWLILSMGAEESKTRSKNIIFYTAIGLIIILLARLFVGFFTKQLPFLI